MDTVYTATFMAKTHQEVHWGMLVVPFFPTGILLPSTSEMEIGVEPVHGGLWRLTSISSVTLSAVTLRNIGHLLPWPVHTGSGLPSAELHYNKE